MPKKNRIAWSRRAVAKGLDARQESAALQISLALGVAGIRVSARNVENSVLEVARLVIQQLYGRKGMLRFLRGRVPSSLALFVSSVGGSIPRRFWHADQTRFSVGNWQRRGPTTKRDHLVYFVQRPKTLSKRNGALPSSGKNVFDKGLVLGNWWN